MNFRQLAKRFICVSGWYKSYPKMEMRIKCNRVLYDISNRLKPIINSSTTEDLRLIHQFTKTPLAYMSDDTEFTVLLFQRNILLDPVDADVLKKFAMFICTYGWQLEANKIEQLLNERKIEKAAKFSISLELYRNGRQHEMTEKELNIYVDKIMKTLD
ncbi:hypothetical protein SRRS_43700 [Sporomusa rhizae]|uniref:hypothetical protein n=1 Tax=Sporomusa rhizae TaxID=357999 RepID=UPI00352B3AEE